jgi:hypothetical protein
MCAQSFHRHSEAPLQPEAISQITSYCRPELVEALRIDNHFSFLVLTFAF